MDISKLTASELLKHYQQLTLSPVEVVKTLFKRIKAINPEINAFVTLNEKQALEQATEAEHAYKSGKVRALEGIPIAIKDLTNTKGIRTTYGSPLFIDNIPDRDATVVSRLKDAGAIIMGKTNTPEFGYKGTTDNLLFGPTRNPWNTSTNAGGSSGGSAAAVSAGLVPLAEGSDGGGSIRIPAAFCGIYGFKPSYGRIPYDNHLDSIFGSHEPFLHFGTLTRSAEDAALMYDVMKGYSTTDPFVLPDDNDFAVDALHDGKRKRLTIGWTLDFGIYEVDDEVKDTFLKAIDGLAENDFDVVAADFKLYESVPKYIEYFEKLWTVGLAAGCEEMVAEHPKAFSDGLIEMVRRGKKLSAVEFKALEADRAEFWHKLQAEFNKYDILISPTLAAPAFAYDTDGPSTINGKPIKADSDWVMTQIYNITGLPAISIPIGLTSEGLPVGLQAAANRLRDGELLRFAHQYEQILGTLSGAVNVDDVKAK